MERIEKTVFLSYRRTNIPWALAIFQNLTHNGFDVFIDFKGFWRKSNIRYFSALDAKELASYPV